MSELTVDVIREEVRNAVFFTLFHATAEQIEGRNQGKAELQRRACFFLEFACKIKLITPQEGNDWLDAVWERAVLGDIAQKYMKVETE